MKLIFFRKFFFLWYSRINRLAFRSFLIFFSFYYLHQMYRYRTCAMHRVIEIRHLFSNLIEIILVGRSQDVAPGRFGELASALDKAGPAYTAKRGKRLNRIGLGRDSGGEREQTGFGFVGLAPLHRSFSETVQFMHHGYVGTTRYQNATPGP